jgi:hypothetical protein
MGYKGLAEGGCEALAFWLFDGEGFWLLDEGRLFYVGGFGRKKDC